SANYGEQLRHPVPVSRNDATYRRGICLSGIIGQALHGPDFLLETVRARKISLVDHEYVSDFHDTGFESLNIVARARHQQQDSDIGQTRNLHFILPDTDSLD